MNTWVESYNIHTRVLIPRILSICIHYEKIDGKSGYQVSIAHRTLKNLFGDIESAKQASILFAERVLLEFRNNVEDMKGEIQE